MAKNPVGIRIRPLCRRYAALPQGHGLVRDLGRRLVKKVSAAIDQSVEGFLQEALQIGSQQVATQLKAEELGYL